jgi:nitrogen fixation NifU-like protein
MSDIYSENIMDHYKNPRNSGNLNNPDVIFYDSNPLCGDEINIYIKIENNKLTDIKFSCEGCAISKASSSIISEKVKEMDIKEILRLDKEFVLSLLKIPINPVRLKCAMLFLRALQKSIAQYMVKNDIRD